MGKAMEYMRIVVKWNSNEMKIVGKVWKQS